MDTNKDGNNEKQLDILTRHKINRKPITRISNSMDNLLDIIISVKKRQSKLSKLSSAYPACFSGMFISETLFFRVVFGKNVRKPVQI